MDIEKRFDLHKWNAKIYNSVDEINRALYEQGIRSKKVKAVQPIGIAKELRSGMGFHLLRKELEEQGSPYCGQTAIDYAERKYPQLDQTMVRCEVTLEEPLVIVFEDASTMEFLPYKEKGLKLSFNQISADVEDGTNDSNFDASSLFGPLVGQSIMGLKVWQDTQERLEDSDYYKRITRFYQFWCTSDFGFTIKEIDGNEYKLELTNQRCFVENHRNATARISFEKFMRSAKPVKQIPIFASTGLTDGFALMPTLWNADDSYSPDWFKGCHEELITVWEDDAYAYLLFFFAKHCSNDYPEWTWGDWEEHEDSEDDVRYNKVVSYELLRTILADIRLTIDLLKADYDDPRLTEVKEMFDPYSFDRMFVYEKPRPEDDMIMREHVDVVIHFYERFCWLIEKMMKNNPQYTFVSIWGP